jgi:hypothetical protein
VTHDAEGEDRPDLTAEQARNRRDGGILGGWRAR